MGEETSPPAPLLQATLYTHLVFGRGMEIEMPDIVGMFNISLVIMS